MAAITLTGLRKSYGKADVIKGVDIAIEDGEFCVFVGPSGCGKSTRLRMIAGLEDITLGGMRIGRTVVNDPPARVRGIAIVFKSDAIFPHMAVHENAAFGLSIASAPQAAKVAAVAEANAGNLNGRVALAERPDVETVVEVTLGDGGRMIAAPPRDATSAIGEPMALALRSEEACLFPA